MAKDKNISVQDGVYVNGAADHSGALKAGIKKSYIVLKINDICIQSVSQMKDVIRDVTYYAINLT